MKDHWSYDDKKYLDRDGEQWHFVWRSFLSETAPYEESPTEIYFRNGSRTFYGLIRFEQAKDNPYKYEKLIEKIIRDKEFRNKHEAEATKQVWLNSWK